MASARRAADSRSRAPCAPERSNSDERLEEKVSSQVRRQMDLARRNLRRKRPSLQELVYIVLNFILIICSKESVKALTFIIRHVLQCLRLCKNRNVENLPHLLNGVGLYPPTVPTAVGSTQTEDKQMANQYTQATSTTATTECQTDFDSNLFTQNSEIMETDIDICKVCYNERIICLTTACAHAFCGKCILRQYELTGVRNCPECRTEVARLIPLPGHSWSEIQQLPFNRIVEYYDTEIQQIDNEILEIDTTESIVENEDELPDLEPTTVRGRRPNNFDVRVFQSDINSYEGELMLDYRYISRYYLIDELDIFRCILCGRIVSHHMIILIEHLDRWHRNTVTLND